MKDMNRGVKLYILAMACAASFLLSAATFANYYSEAGLSGSVQVARWEFDAALALDKDSGEVYTLELRDTSGTAANGRIAPGSKGSFLIQFKKGNSSTRQLYKIKTIRTSLPEQLRFYTDAACTKELQDSEEFEDTLPTRTIYWKWNFTDTDETEWQTKSVKAGLLIQAYQKV